MFNDGYLDGYHTGKYGFDIFTHFRATLESPKMCVLTFPRRALLKPISISIIH